jgi:DNA-binding HxlR family transcriptional regulator
LQVFVVWVMDVFMPPRESRSVPPKRVGRSPCPIACGLDIFGDRWSLLLVRDMVFGAERFRDFLSAPERIPTNILADRLERLVRQGIIESCPARDGTKRTGYRLTAKGHALRPVLEAMRDWGLAWVPGSRALIGGDGATI